MFSFLRHILIPWATAQTVWKIVDFSDPFFFYALYFVFLFLSRPGHFLRLLAGLFFFDENEWVQKAGKQK